MGKILLVILVFAAVVYSLFWLVERRRRLRSRPGPARPAPYRRTLGPDDDEDFLRELEQRRRRAAREKPAKPKDAKPSQKKPTEKTDRAEKPAAPEKSEQDRPRPE